MERRCADSVKAHDAQRRTGRRPIGPPSLREITVEMFIGLALIVVAGLLIVGIIRTVQSNMGKS